MQDYLSSGFAPSVSNKFAPSSSANFAPAYDQSIHMLAHKPVAHVPSGRREFISQQERNIRNGFLRKTSTKSETSLLTINGNRLNAQPRFSSIRMKLAASAIALCLIIFAGQLGSSCLNQQLAGNALSQSSSGNSDTAKNLSGAVANVSATTSHGAAVSATFNDARKIEEIIADAQAHAGAAKAEIQSKQILSISAPDVDLDSLDTMTTVNLVKIGYERLQAGSTQESISLLTEAVRRDRNDPTSRRYLGYALLQAGRPSEALGQYDALQKLSDLLPADRMAMQHAMRIAQSASLSPLSHDRS